MTDSHLIDFEDLLSRYNYPIVAWATADLVKLSTIIDIELQQRAEDYQHVIYPEG
jgi:hypothetical protein